MHMKEILDQPLHEANKLSIIRRVNVLKLNGNDSIFEENRLLSMNHLYFPKNLPLGLAPWNRGEDESQLEVTLRQDKLTP